MYLLNVDTLILEYFVGTELPIYAILSHTWGPDEARFHDYATGTQVSKASQRAGLGRHPAYRRTLNTGRHSRRRPGRHGQGHTKIQECCRRAKEDGIKYVWVDTICIDKSSSAELSEAINSMFKYYQNAKVCYVFLSDVGPEPGLFESATLNLSGTLHSERQTSTAASGTEVPTSHDSPLESHGFDSSEAVRPFDSDSSSDTGPVGSDLIQAGQYHKSSWQWRLRHLSSVSDLKNARWFKRGWTLQELIAPRFIQFFDRTWTLIGCSGDGDLSEGLNDEGIPKLTSSLANLTGIPIGFLNGNTPLQDACVGTRISWVCGRETTRPEDMAYCMLGILGVNMPLLYGEGSSAFERLQEEVIKKYNDHSIFAFADIRKLSKTAELMRVLHTAGTEPIASDAGQFQHFRNTAIQTIDTDLTSHYTLTNNGVHIELPTCQLPSGEILALLSCRTESSTDPKRLCLMLTPRRYSKGMLYRRVEGSMTFVSATELDHRPWHGRQFYLTSPPSIQTGLQYDLGRKLEIDLACFAMFNVQTCYPMLREYKRGLYYADVDVAKLSEDEETLAIYLDCVSVDENPSHFVLCIEHCGAGNCKRRRPAVGQTSQFSKRLHLSRSPCTGHLSMVHRKPGLSVPQLMLTSRFSRDKQWVWDVKFQGRKVLLEVEPTCREATLRLEMPEEVMSSKK